MEVEKESPYDTVTYKWGEIKECLRDFNMKIPPHLVSKDEDDSVLFIIYPGRMKQVNNRNTLSASHFLSVLAVFGLELVVHNTRQGAKPHKRILF